MRHVLFFAIAAMVIAGVMPRVMGEVGKAPEAQPATATQPAAQANYRTFTVRGEARGHFQVEGSVDGRRRDFVVDTGDSVIALRERDASRLGQASRQNPAYRPAGKFLREISNCRGTEALRLR